MDAREMLIGQLDACLSRLEQQESDIASRAASLLAVTALAVSVVLGLRQADNGVPVLLGVVYLLLAVILAVLGSVTIGGRQLVDAIADNDLRRHWYGLSAAELQDVLLDTKRIALRVNTERIRLVRTVFRVHLVVVALTLVATLLVVRG